jgi:hypothetical protein
LVFSAITWIFRMLSYQFDWYSLPSYSVCIHRFFNSFFTCFLLSLCVNMWCR